MQQPSAGDLLQVGQSFSETDICDELENDFRMIEEELELEGWR